MRCFERPPLGLEIGLVEHAHPAAGGDRHAVGVTTDRDRAGGRAELHHVESIGGLDGDDRWHLLVLVELNAQAGFGQAGLERLDRLGLDLEPLAQLDRLEVDDKRLRQFVSDASHELRSPVAVLRSEAEVALRSPERTDPRAFADGVLGESLRLERIVDDLLLLARRQEAASAGAGSAPPSPFDLDDVVFAEAGRRRRVPIETSGVSAGRVAGSKHDATRLVAHLLDKGARHAVTRVAVSLAADDGETVVLTVDDDGPGVAADDRERVFERFTRLEEARTRDNGGAGLGLAVVAATVQGMGGTVGVEDAPELGGARFAVRLPAVG